MATTTEIIRSLRSAARTLGMPGTVDRSTSGTVYVGIGHLVRIADHELGFADYGSREQVHGGPECVFGGRSTLADILADALAITRDWASGRSSCRREAADALRVLRLAHRRAADPARVARNEAARARRAALAEQALQVKAADAERLHQETKAHRAEAAARAWENCSEQDRKLATHYAELSGKSRKRFRFKHRDSLIRAGVVFGATQNMVCCS